MARALVPIFPLPELTFFPHTLLPLHIFEARYRAMVTDCLARDKRMAVVGLKPGYEASYEGKPAVHEIARSEPGLRRGGLLEHLHDEHAEAFTQAVLLGDLVHLLLGQVADPHPEPAPGDRFGLGHQPEHEHQDQEKPVNHRSPVSWV